MPVTWCYQLEDERQYCSTGFPMGCYSKESRSQQDTCTILVRTSYWIIFQNYENIKFNLSNGHIYLCVLLGSVQQTGNLLFIQSCESYYNLSQWCYRGMGIIF